MGHQARNEMETEDGRWVESDPLPFYTGPVGRVLKQLRGARFELRYHAGHLRERAVMGFVWRLPREIIRQAVIRAWAHATTGPYGATDVAELTVMEMVKRWEDGPHPKPEYGPSADDDPLEEPTVAEEYDGPRA